ncbi:MULTISPECIES: DUF6133 family protein [unclassified Oscillibacter]|uniref:DUF6133 family protein n=1 Tax=unclassified Oscillibacter TaxID=2629304 RepID=UPI0025CBC2D9|nr:MULTISPECIES: DUF6133 family protein [unclassified Oscillibacter]
MNTLKNTLNAAMTKVYIRARLYVLRMKDTLKDESGQFVMDHAVVFVIIIVLGALALLLLKNFLNNDMAPTLKTKIMEFFN